MADLHPLHAELLSSPRTLMSQGSGRWLMSRRRRSEARWEANLDQRGIEQHPIGPRVTRKGDRPRRDGLSCQTVGPRRNGFPRTWTWDLARQLRGSSSAVPVVAARRGEGKGPGAIRAGRTTTDLQKRFPIASYDKQAECPLSRSLVLFGIKQAGTICGRQTSRAESMV